MAEGYINKDIKKILYKGNPENNSYHDIEDVKTYQYLLLVAMNSSGFSFTAFHVPALQRDLYVTGNSSDNSISVIFTERTKFLARNKGNSISELEIYGIS